MNSKLLVDAIVRQTTVLIAQLCTAAGVRAPLAQIADQVFLGLSREIEAQGVGRKVAADMFGLVLRSYQKKVQRLTESSTERERTLWEALLELLQREGSVSRGDLNIRFGRDGEMAVASVLKDLVGSGLVSVTGRGLAARYSLTSERERGSAMRRVACSVNVTGFVSAPLSALANSAASGMLLHKKYERRDASS